METKPDQWKVAFPTPAQLTCLKHFQACDLQYFDKRPLSRPFGLYRLEPTSPTQVLSRLKLTHAQKHTNLLFVVIMKAVAQTLFLPFA